MKFKSLTTLSLGLLGTFAAFSQNLEKAGKKDMVHTGGGICCSSIFYDATGLPNRRQPFTWFVSGNVSTSILDINLPFSFNYSNNQIAYSQPYMLQSFNPTYKWIKGYAGVTSMNFSQYTLASHVFSGGGIEMTPQNFKIAAMYGRLKKAVEYDAINNSALTMSYKRMGAGLSLGYEKKGHGVKFIFFTAKDDPYSLAFTPLNSAVMPMQNSVISFSGKTTLLKKFKLETEYALSGLTRSLASPEVLGPVVKTKMPFLKTNATSQFFDAFKSSIGYSQKILNINLIYERIDPEYKTLGGYYFNNDLENITISPSVNLMKGKMTIAFNTGIQRNNLDRSKLSTSKRWVGSLTTSYAPNKKWNFIGSYSNFSTFTRQRPHADPFTQTALDTFNFYQLSQTAMSTIAYNFGNSARKQNIILTANYQVVAQATGSITDPGFLGSETELHTPSRVITGNLGHTIAFTPGKSSINSSININYGEILGIPTLYYGPNLNFSKALAKNKVRLNIGSSYNKVLTSSSTSDQVFNHRIGFNYSPKFANAKAGKINFSIAAGYLTKLKSSQSDLGLSEFTGNFSANYSF